MADQNEMLNIITPMMEHVCDHLCRFPKEVANQEELDIICGGCEMDQYTNDILNTYNQQAEHVRVEADWKRHLMERFGRCE